MYQRSSSSRETRAERAVTEVLGAILVFGLVLAVLALVQVSGIPAANEQVEFEHSQRVAGDFQSLDASIDAAGTRGSLGSAGIEAGVRYPNRLFFVNPGPAGGSLLSDSIPVDLNGFEGTEIDGSDDYLISDTDFTTTSLRYQAGYNEYANAPTLYYENGVVFERYESDDGSFQDIVVDAGNLVNGNRISIITTVGDFSTQVPGEVSVNVVPVSTGSRAVTVTGTAPEIVLQTRLSEEEWVSILRDQFDGNSVSGDPASCDDVSLPGSPLANDGKRVVDCEYTAPGAGSEFGELTLTFEEGSYDLRMARVGLTTNDNDNPTADFAPTGARYLVTVEGDGSTITDEQTQRLTVEVRDDFNNPVSGIEVSFSTDDGEFQSTDADGTTSTTTTGSTSATTDVNGQASIVFEPDTTGDLDVLAAADLDDDGGTNDGDALDDDPEEVTFDLSVSDADGGIGDGLERINSRDSDVYFESGDFANSDSKRITATFRNAGTTTDWTVEEMRISFVLAQNPVNDADVGDVTGSTAVALGNLEVAGGFVNTVDVDIPKKSGGTEGRLTLQFDFNQSLGTGSPKQKFMVLSVRMSDESGNEVIQTYFITDTT